MSGEPAKKHSSRLSPPQGIFGASRNCLQVAKAGNVIVISIHGLGNMNNAGGLQEFCRQAIQDGCSRFAFDMADCKSMDSTFMGTVVGLAVAVREKSDDAWVCMLNARPEHLELLEIVGADRFLRFKEDVPIEDIEMEPLVAKPVSPEERLALLKKAHENLVEIDARNRARFGAFLRSLSADLEQG